jgi:hypothetical protein
MKKTSEELSEAQEQATIRRRLLESGKIRLIRPEPKPSGRQKDEAEGAAKRTSK